MGKYSGQKLSFQLGGFRRNSAALCHDSLNAGDFTTQLFETGRIFKLTNLLLNTKVKHFLAKLTTTSTKLFDGVL
jgi:hypothetical protein